MVVGISITVFLPSFGYGETPFTLWLRGLDVGWVDDLHSSAVCEVTFRRVYVQEHANNVVVFGGDCRHETPRSVSGGGWDQRDASPMVPYPIWHVGDLNRAGAVQCDYAGIDTFFILM